MTPEQIKILNYGSKRQKISEARLFYADLLSHDPKIKEAFRYVYSFVHFINTFRHLMKKKAENNARRKLWLVTLVGLSI